MPEPIEKNIRPGYLVIAPKAFHDELAPLVKERAKRYEVTLADIESLGTTHPAKFRHESIRQYVKDVYVKSGGSLKYLLIVGDDKETDDPNEVPIGIYPRDGNRAAIPSDAYYGDMQGDLWPEVSVGRIPATTEEEAALAIKKILAYRPSPSTLAFYGGQVNFGPIQDLLLEGLVSVMIQRLIPQTIPVNVHYDSPDSAFHTDKSFLQMLNSGPAILTYMGHGSPDALQTRNYFDLNGLNAVDIKGGATILNLLACSAGCFADKDCLGEALLLHPKGPIAVIGSSEIVSPVVLYFFAGGMTAYLEHPEGATLGDVFLAAQKASESPGDLLWKIISLLPPRSQDKLYLKPRLSEAALRQSLQMTLLGDPALTWMTGKKAATAKNDPRQKIPRSMRPMPERITIDNAPIKTPAGETLDSRSMQTEDLSSILLLLDYLFYRSSELFDNYKALLPKAGETTVADGIFSIPIHGRFELKDNQLQPSISQALFPQGTSGTVKIEGELKFGLRMTAEGLNIYSIEGISFETPSLVPSRQTLSELNITFRPEPRLETVFMPSPLTDEELQKMNDLLAEGSKGNSHYLRLERDDKGNDAAFALYLQKPDSKEFVRVLQLHASLSGMRPIVTKAGIALPLPYGVLAHGIEKEGEGYRLALEPLPYGLKHQYYIYVPANPHEELVNSREAVGIDFEAMKRLGGNDDIYDLMPIPSGDIRLPVYLAYPASSPVALQIGSAIGKTSKGSASPFGKRGDGTKVNADLEDVDWSGHLGAKICIAVDGSGSMGEQVERLWPQLEKLWGKIPDFARSFVDISIVAVSDAGFKELLPMTPLSEVGMNGLLAAVDEIPFRGPTDQLKEGAKYCARVAEPQESGLIYRSAILLTDAQGDVKLEIGDATKLVIDKLEVPAGNFILKPKIMQQIADIKEASNSAALEGLYQTVEKFKEPTMPEAVVGAAIKELVKFDDPGLIRLVAPLTEIALGDFDWPLTRDTIQALGVLARRGITEAHDALLAIDSKLSLKGELHQLISDALKASLSNEERALKLYAQVFKSPGSVQPEQFADCGPVDAAVNGLIRIARYSNKDRRREALVQLGIILRGAAGDPMLKDKAMQVKILLEELVDLGLEEENSSYIFNTAFSIGIKLWEDEK